MVAVCFFLYALAVYIANLPEEKSAVTTSTQSIAPLLLGFAGVIFALGTAGVVYARNNLQQRFSLLVPSMAAVEATCMVLTVLSVVESYNPTVVLYGAAASSLVLLGFVPFTAPQK